MSSYPAYTQLGREIGRRFACWRLYMYLQPPILDFIEPRDVKVWFVMEQLHMGRRQTINSLEWLTERGYLVEHGRDGRKVRSLTLAWAATPRKAVTAPVSVSVVPTSPSPTVAVSRLRSAVG